MKTPTIALFLCTLIASTFAHDYQRAAQLSHEARLHANPLLAHIQQRQADTADSCGWVCPIGPVNPPHPGNSSSGLSIVINESANITAIVNGTAHVALVIDISANIVAVLNGSAGSAILIDLTTTEGVYIAAGASSEVWVASQTSIEAYIGRLTSLRALFQVGLRVGVRFNLGSVSRDVLRQIRDALVCLSVEYISIFAASNAQALTAVIELSQSITVLLRGTLAGLLQGAGHLVIERIRGDVRWLVAVLRGLAQVTAAAQGGLAALVRAGVRLNLQVILTAASGFEVFIHVLTQISARVDVAATLGRLLNDVQAVLHVIFALGGNVIRGYDGVVKIIYDIYALSTQRVSIEVVIDALIQFSISTTAAVDTHVFIGYINQLIRIVGSGQGAQSLQALITFLQHVRDGNLTIGGVNVSEIITALSRGAVDGALNLVVRIIILLRGSIDTGAAIVQLVFNLIGYLNSTSGIQILTHLNIEIDQSIVVQYNGNVVEYIASHVNVGEILRYGFNLDAILSHIPIINNIYNAVSASVQSASGGSLRLSTLIRSSGARSVVVRIIQWLSSSLHIQIGGSIHL